MLARLSKIRPFILLFLIAASVAINAFDLATSAYAAPANPGPATTTPTDPATLYIAPEVQADAVASAYRTSLALCLTGNNNGGHDLTSGTTQYRGRGGTSNTQDQINAQDAANGNWFTGAYDFRPGVLVWNKADDYIGCNDIFKYGTLQALGAPDLITLACDVGMTRTDGQNCLNDPSQSNLQQTAASTDRNQVYAALDKLRTNASAPPKGGWNDAQTYVDIMQTLVGFCGATADANVGGQNANPTIQARDHSTQFPVVDGSGTTTTVYYNVPDTGKKAMLMNFSDNFQWWEDNCGNELVRDATKYAPGYAAYVKQHPQASNDPGSAGNVGPGASPGKTSCVISGVGWILCPVMNFMAQVTDVAYNAISSMLTVPPVSTDTGSPLFKAWSIMRNFANVIFVIAFMFVIYSQITGMGLNNYGIKRLLPRIIVTAVLVNLSYWICAVAVDASNILGSSLSGLLEGVANFNKSPAGSGNVWGALTATLITGGTALYIGLAAFVPILLSALLAIITTVVVLTVRQAFITLFIAASPLIFAAELLPNTRGIGGKLRSIAVQMLLLFPEIALVFGGSKLASVIIDTPKAPFLVQVMGAGITVIPLIIIPTLIKTTTNVMGRFGGWINNPNKGPIDRMRKGAEGYRKNRQEYRKLKDLNPKKYSLPGRAAVTRKRAQRQAVLNNRQAELNVATSSYISGLARDNPKFRNRLAQGGTEGAEGRALAHALNIQAKLKADEVTAATAVIKEANLGTDLEAMQTLARGGKVSYQDGAGKTHELSAPAGSALQTAAIQQQFKNGDVKKMDELVSASGGMGIDQRQAVAEGMQAMSGKVRYYGGNASNTVAQGGVKSEGDLNKLVADSIADGKWSGQILADSDKDALERTANVAADRTSTTSSGETIKDEQIDQLKAAVQEIEDNKTIKRPDSRTQDRLNAIKSGTTFPP